MPSHRANDARLHAALGYLPHSGSAVCVIHKCPPKVVDNSKVTSLDRPSCFGGNTCTTVAAVATRAGGTDCTGRTQGFAETKPLRGRQLCGFTSVLLTPRLAIRPLDRSDQGEMIRVLAENRVHFDKHIPLQAAEESAADAFERALDLTERGDGSRTAWRRVGIDESGRIVGGCAVYSIVRGFTMEASIHWWISADAQRKSFGTEIVSAAIAHATADLPTGLGLHTLNATIAPDNVASIALAQRVGFRRIGKSIHPIRVGDRWERVDEYRFTAPSVDEARIELDQGTMSSGSCTGGIAVASMPGRALSVPSRSTRS